MFHGEPNPSEVSIDWVSEHLDQNKTGTNKKGKLRFPNPQVITSSQLIKPISSSATFGLGSIFRPMGTTDL